MQSAQRILPTSGFSKPAIRNFDDTARIGGTLDRPINVLMDVEPRNAETLALPGRVVDQASDARTDAGAGDGRGQAGGIRSDPAAAIRRRRSASCLPRRCLQEGGPLAGFVTFSYELAPLMLGNDDLSLFSVVLTDPRNEPAASLSPTGSGIVGARDAVLVRAPAPRCCRA